MRLTEDDLRRMEIAAPPEVEELVAEVRRLKEENLEWRGFLWVSHGHSSELYGDDGEMQCNHATCMIDYKRDSIDRVVKSWIDHLGKGRR